MVGTSSAAPGALETVRRFVNTLDIEAATDELATPVQLGAWLRRASLLESGVVPHQHDLEHAVEVREAIRAALAANHDGAAVSAEALAALNGAADRAHLSVRLTAHHGWIMRPRASGVDAAVGRLLGHIGDAMADGTWRRLKVCVSDTCQWAFFDHSRARSGKWCSMRACGNRAKQQAWRLRHADLSASPG